jgi:hypothetical protein
MSNGMVTYWFVDNPDSFALVALTDVAGGTQVFCLLTWCCDCDWRPADGLSAAVCDGQWLVRRDLWIQSRRRPRQVLGTGRRFYPRRGSLVLSLSLWGCRGGLWRRGTVRRMGEYCGEKLSVTHSDASCFLCGVPIVFLCHVLCEVSDCLTAWGGLQGSLALSTSGDQLIVYTDSTENPNFLYLFSNTPLVTNPNDVSSTTTMLPTALSGSSAYCVTSNLDNAGYTGSTVGRRADLLLLVSNGTVSWTGNNAQQVALELIPDFTVLSEPTSAPSQWPVVSPSAVPTAPAKGRGGSAGSSSGDAFSQQSLAFIVCGILVLLLAVVIAVFVVRSSSGSSSSGGGSRNRRAGNGEKGRVDEGQVDMGEVYGWGQQQQVQGGGGGEGGDMKRSAQWTSPRSPMHPSSSS